MGKEMTLGELTKQQIASGQNNSNVNMITSTEIHTNNRRPEGRGSGVKAVSLADLTKGLEEAHPEEVEARRKAKEVVNAPLVTDAFAAFENTINAKKQAADEMYEQARADAEQAAMDNDAVEAADAEINKPNITLDDIDTELSNDLNDDEDVIEEKPQPKYIDITPKEEVRTIPEPPVVNEVKEEDNITPIHENIAHKDSVVIDDKEVNEDISMDLNELDNLLNDINEEQAKKPKTTEEDEETVEEIRARLKNNMGDSISATKNPINFSEFKIRDKPAALNHIFDKPDEASIKKKADWVLYHTGRPVTFMECYGPELEALRKTVDASNDVNKVVASLKFLYNHIIDANKPSFEAWTKSIRTEDFESLCFGQYLACYSDSNLVARNHEDCKKTSLINTNPYDMVKYHDDKVKEEFMKIRNGDTTTPTDEIESTFLQVSDNFAITFVQANLYSTFIQYSALEGTTVSKYSDYLNYMAYVDKFYYIDRVNNELIPIEPKVYRGNINKTVLEKLKIFIKILKTLNNDQYSILIGKLGSIGQETKINYILPKVECPECGGEIPEEPVISMLNLLFFRAQLAQLKSL